MNRRLTADRVWMAAVALAIAGMGWLNAVHQPAIEGDGIDQVTLGANLVGGRGYRGPDGAVELHFPPLYPALVGVASRAAPDLERAGRLVSVVAGALLVWPVFRLAALAGGLSMARVAVVLLAGIPSLASVNSRVGGEGVYTLCVTLGALALWRAASGAPAACALAGGALGLAYLARIEAMGYLLLPAALIILWRRAGVAWDRIAAGTAGFIAAFLLAASPYLWTIHRETGRWMGSPKFAKVLLYGEAVDPAVQEKYGALSYEAVAYGLAPDGLALATVARRHEVETGGIAYAVRRLPTLAARYVNNFYSLYTRQMWAIVPPAMFALALIGLVGVWARGPRPAALAGLAAPFLLWLSFPVARVEPRFLLPQAPLVCVAAAAGLARLTERARRPWSAVGLALMLTLAYLPDLLLPTVAARWRPYKQEAGAEMKAAGLWIRDHAGGGAVVMDRRPVASFYAGARFVPLPFAEPDEVLRYARHHGVTHVVLEEAVVREVRPQLARWLGAGALPGLERLAVLGTPDRCVLVFRLK